MWSLTSPRVERISGPEKFGSSAKGLFQQYRHKADIAIASVNVRFRRDERTRRSGTRIVDSQLAQDISRMLFASGISRLSVSDSAGRGFSALEAVASIALRISSTVASV